MTREEILKMKSGKELDILISEFMDIETGALIWEDDVGNKYYESVRQYSTDISLAMIVVEYLRTKGYGF